MSNLVRFPTGATVLDKHLDGGLPQGYVVNLRGEPGSGKTLLATQIALKNAQLGRKTLYVSFIEDKDKFVNAASTLLPGLKRHMDDHKIEYLELSSVIRGGVQPIMEMVLEKVESERPHLLVFDSYTAVLQALGSEAEGRSVLSNLFSRIFSKNSVTTLIITEGDQNDFVSYVADGIIRLSRKREAESPYRELEILKMRSLQIGQSRFLYVFQKGKGVRVFNPFNGNLGLKINPRPPITEKEGFYSTGSRSLDRVVGGYPKGSLVLWEMGSNTPQLVHYSAVLASAANFLVQGRGVMILPSLEFELRDIKPFIYPDKNTFEGCARIFLDNLPPDQSLNSVVVPITGDGEKDLAKWEEVYQGFKKQGKPVLKVVSLDLLEHLYGGENAISMLRRAYTSTAYNRDVTVMLAKPGLHVTEELKYMARVRLSLRFVDGYIIFRGISPYTENYLYEPRFSMGYPEIHLYKIN
ncbi:MAG: RAD55 family ATPase [Thermoprotei archaeon]